MEFFTDNESLQISQRLNKGIKESIYNHTSLRELARILGYSHTTINRWRSGQATPSFKAALRLCAVLKISLEWLLTGNGRMNHVRLSLDETAIIQIFRSLDKKEQRKFIKLATSQLAKFNTKT